jgi:predicted small secreted protein
MIASNTSFTRGLVLCIAATAIVLGFAACNTVSGAGKDIKSTGKAIEHTAEDNK